MAVSTKVLQEFWGLQWEGWYC